MGKKFFKKSEKDGYNCKYRRGSKIFRGNFFNRFQENVLHFSLDATKQALVLSETERYICTTLQEFYDDND